MRAKSNRMEWDLAKMEEQEASNRALTNVIKPVPVGFNCLDAEMARSGEDAKKVRQYLAAQAGNESTYFMVGAGVVGDSNKKLRLGHAELVVRVYNGIQSPDDPIESPTLKRPLRIALNDPKPEMDIRLPKSETIVIHLHYIGNDTELTLEYQELGESELRLAKYIDLCRILTTKRMLKHIALKTCPGFHSVIRSDCATVVQNFVAELVDQLKAPGTTDEEVQNQTKVLLKQIRIEDGSFGVSEDQSRRHRS